jgi:hypothetical protein
VVKILQVITILFYIVGKNDYIQSQILVEFKSIRGKMESLKAYLEAKFYHPIGNILATIVDGNNLSLKKNLTLLIS